MVLRALGANEYNQLRGRTSPDPPEGKGYADLVTLLMNMFGNTKSLFRCRHDILLGSRLPPGKTSEEIVNVANLKGDDFEFKNLTLDNFKIFIMLLQLADPSYQGLRAVIIRAVDDKPDISIDEIRSTLKRYETRTSDAQIDSNSNAVASEQFGISALHASSSSGKLTPRAPRHRTGGKFSSSTTTSTKCAGCGGDHFRKSCKFRDATCRSCKKTGHIAKVCRSVRANTLGINSVLSSSQLAEGRTFVSVLVNGVPLKFRADSGADISTIGTRRKS